MKRGGADGIAQQGYTAGMPGTNDATNGLVQAGDPARKRRVRNTTATRAAILEAARTLLAKDGPDGVSLSEVAKLAGVNRGTADQHFATREAVLEAAVAEVSAEMFRAVFGDPETIGERDVGQVDMVALAEPGIDSEVWSVIMLASNFLWPMWVRALSHGDADRGALAHRFAREMLRLSMHGTVRVEKYPEIAALLEGEAAPGPMQLRAV